MNPLHQQRTTGGAPAASELVPEAHGYGFIAASEAPAHVQSAPPKVTPPAQQPAEPERAAAPAEPVEPLIEFITDTPAEATEAPAEFVILASPVKSKKPRQASRLAGSERFPRAQRPLSVPVFSRKLEKDSLQ